jgi:isopropylmalate/homocitrate/citramalate synthase
VSVVIRDVGPRDGLQNLRVTFSPEQRAGLSARLAACGLKAVEAASFVREDRVPQMAGAEDVASALPDAPGVSWSALVLNERGVQRALAAGIGEVHVAVMATDSFARSNTNMSLADALARTGRMVGLARAGGARVVGSVSVAFGCPFEGRVPERAALAVAEALAAAGADELVLSDTIGVATPRAVRSLVRRALELDVPVGVHLHDTRNTGTANSLMALDAGATSFETAVGGLGGCPFAPGASGNLATEDLVYVLEEEGVATGVDLDAVIRVSRRLEKALGGPVPAALTRAGGRAY